MPISDKINNKHFYRILEVSSVFVGVIMALYYFYPVFASPPTTPYTPGETTDPSCSPGDTNCTVYPPLTTSLTTSTAITLGASSLRFAYDSSNYTSLSVASDGALTVSSTGGVTTTFRNKISFLANAYFNTIASGTWNGGVIGITYGGTNSSTISANGSVIYSDGSRYNASAVGATGQVLQSTGSGAPVWVNTSSLGLASGAFVDLQSATSGTQQTGHLNISGTGLFGAKVGIGTTTPIATLSVLATATNGNSPIFEVASSSGASFMRVLANGNVGIGTIFPSSTLEVAGGVLTLAYQQGINSRYSTGASSNILKVDTGTLGLLNGVSNTTILSAINGLELGASGVAIGIRTEGTLPGISFSTASTERLRLQNDGRWGFNSSSPKSQFTFQGLASTSPLFDIASSSGDSLFRMLANGNVGIGTASPGAPLHVVGNSYLTGSIFTNDITSYTGGQITILNGDSGIRFLMNTANGFYTWNDSSNASLMYIQASGKVAIGTTTPTAKLTIQGSGTSNPFAIVSSTAAASSMFTVLTNGNVGINSSTPLAQLAIQGTAEQDPLKIVSTTGAAMLSMNRVGFIGIGTDPHTTSILNINGNTLSTGEFRTAVSGVVAIYATAGYIRSDYTDTGSFPTAFYAPNGGYMGRALDTTGGATLLLGEINAAGVRLGRANSWNSTLGSFTINTTTVSSTFAVQGIGGYNLVSIVSSSGSSMFHISTNGKIGIGTSTPTEAIVLNDSANTDTRIRFFNASTGQASTDGALFGLSNGTQFEINNLENGDMFFSTGNSNRLTIKSTGLVGIGTTTPQSVLTIQGGAQNPFSIVSSTAAANSMFTVLTNGRVGINSSSPIDTLAVQGSLQVVGGVTSTNLNVTGLTNLSGVITFGSASGTSMTSTRFIATSVTSTNLNVTATSTFGAVGVGTTTPREKLSVVGNVSNVVDPNTAMSQVGTASVVSNPLGVFVSGKYAYVTNQVGNALSVVDVSNPLHAIQIATTSVGTNPNHVYVSGRYAYVTNGNGSNISIVDISNPSAPRQVSTLTVNGGPKSPFVSGGYLYITNSTGNVLTIIDVSNPLVPVRVSTTSVGNSPQSVYVSGRFAYVANFGEASISVVDVSNPHAPVHIVSTSVGTNPESIYVSGRYAYTANSGANTVSVVDISSSSAPIQVGSIATSDPTSIFVSGRYAFVANSGGNSLSVIDVASSTNPVLLKNVTVGTAPKWVHVSGRYAYITNYSDANISIVDISGTEVTSLVAHSAEVGNLQALNDVFAQGNIMAGTGLMVGAGGIMSNGALSVFASTTGSTSSIFRIDSAQTRNIFKVFANGNIGIGTSTAASSLTVQGSGTSNPFSIVSSTAAASSMLTVLTNGNVGINTTTPEALLHISGSGASLRLSNTNSTGRKYDILSELTGYSNAGFVIRDVTASANRIAIGPSGEFGINSTTLANSLSLTGIAGTNLVDIASSTGASMLRILTNGNVGIGSSTPTGSLVVGSGQILIPDGTVDAPSVAFINGINFGIYKNAGSVAISAGGILSASFTSTGATVAGLGIQNSTNAEAGGFAMTTGQIAWGSSPTMDLGLRRGSTNTLYVGTGAVGSFAGNVVANKIGIGTSTLLAKLTIQGSGAENPFSIVTSTAAASSMFTILTDGRVGINSSSPIASLAVQGVGGTNMFEIASSTGASILRILTNGRVGVGVAEPDMTIHGREDVNAQAGLRFDNANGGTTASTLSDLRNGGLSASESGLIGITGGGYTAVTGWTDAVIISAQSAMSGGTVINAVTKGISFEVGGNGSASQRAMITDLGFGINSSSPQATLAVQGVPGRPIFKVVSSSNGVSPFEVDVNGDVAIRSAGGSHTFNFTESAGLVFSSSFNKYFFAGTNPYFRAYSSTGIGLRGNLSTLAGVGVFVGNEDPRSNTSGTSTQLQIQGSFVPTSGTGDFVGFDVTPTVSTTGSYNGQYISAMRISPLLTSATATRNYLLDVGTNTAASGAGVHTSVFVIDKNGRAGVNSSSPVASFALQGTGGTNPFEIASSTGASLFRILTNGNVGIGSSTPSTALVIGSTGALSFGNVPATTGVIRLENNTGIYGRRADNASDLNLISLNTSNQTLIGNSTGASIFTSDVGFGTDNTFDFGGGTRSPRHIFARSSLVIGTSTLQVGSTGLTIQGSGSGNPFSILTSTAAASSMFTVLTNGNVGISTSTPSERLSVVGNISNIISPSDTTAIRQIATTSVGNGPQSVFVSGRYAYVANTNSNTISIVDISNPSRPVQISTTSVGNGPKFITVSGRYAYVANGNSDNISIVDISNPRFPRSVSTVDVGDYPSSIAVSGRYAYVTNYLLNTISVIDVANPLSPVHIASTTISSNPVSIVVSGRYAFTANEGTNSMSVIDISNPNIPVQVGNTAVGSVPQSIYVSGRYAYVANLSGGTLSVVDISNPSAPSAVGTSTVGSGPQSVFVSGRYAYVANLSSANISIVDISSSTAPAQVATTAVEDSPYSIFVSGRYAYVVNNGSKSLSVVDISGTEVSSLIAHSAEVGNLQSRNDIFAQGNIMAGTSLMVGVGGIMSNGALSVFASSTGATSSIFNISSAQASNLLKVLANGNVGINTTTPLAKLDIWGAGNTSSTISLNTHSASGTSTFKVDDAGNVSFANDGIYYEASSSISYINSLETGAINFDDNAGIVSFVDMEVSSTVVGTPNSYTASMDGNPMIQVYGDSNGTGGVTNLTVSIGTSTTSTARLFVLGSDGKDIVDFASSTGTSILRITAGGRIGIGTTTPTARFMVQGAGTENPFSIVSSTAAASSMFTIRTDGRIGINSSSPIASLALQGTGGINPFSINSSTGAPLLSVLTNGRVAIGTTTPIGTLAIQGSGTANPFIVVSSTAEGVIMFGVATNGVVTIGSSAAGLGGSLTIISGSASTLDLNRETDDGTIVNLMQGGNIEGTISVSGITVSYNAFTGSHYGWTDTAIERGHLVSLTGDNRHFHNNPLSEILYGIAPSATINDSRILGSYLSLQDPNKPADEDNPHLVMSVGNGDLWVVENESGDVAIGDYLISSDTSGHAMKDPGTYATSYVVARATEAIDWETVTNMVDGKKQKKIIVTFEAFSKNGIIKTLTENTVTYPLDPACDTNGNCPQAGDVVCVAEGVSPTFFIERCSATSTDSIIGVVSGNSGTSSQPVALSGHVSVNVSVANGSIKAGDYLTSSAVPGVAVKAIEPGKVIGTALQSFDGSVSGTGTVKVFVNTGWSLGSAAALTEVEESVFPDFAQVVLDKFTLAVKNSLRKLGFLVKDGVATVKQLFAERIKTEQLCVGETCINEEQLRDLLNKTSTPAASSGQPAVDGQNDVVIESPTQPIVPTSTEDGVGVVEQVNTPDTTPNVGVTVSSSIPLTDSEVVSLETTTTTP